MKRKWASRKLKRNIYPFHSFCSLHSYTLSLSLSVSLSSVYGLVIIIFLCFFFSSGVCVRLHSHVSSHRASASIRIASCARACESACVCVYFGWFLLISSKPVYFVDSYHSSKKTQRIFLHSLFRRSERKNITKCTAPQRFLYTIGRVSFVKQQGKQK